MRQTKNVIAAPSVASAKWMVFSLLLSSLQELTLSDPDRIEVLRGPCGTVFGQNFTGGMANVINTLPSFDELSGKVDLTLGDYRLHSKQEEVLTFLFQTSVATRLFSVTTRSRWFYRKSQ